MEFSEESILRQILVRIPKERFSEISRVSNYRERWFEVLISNGSASLSGAAVEGYGFTAHLNLNRESAFQDRFELSVVDRNTSIQLNRVVREDGADLSQSNLSRLNSCFPVDKFTVFNVGQGCASRADFDGEPVFYFDIGGGCFWNRHTYPSVTRFDSQDSTKVLLSHWDMDHFFSALDGQNVDILRRTWIAPGPVPTRPTHSMLAKKIRKNGRLFLWPPNGLNFAETSFGSLLARAGAKFSNRNGSGIVLSVLLISSAGCRRILLTGDADYRHIPSTILRDNDIVVVPHHGGIRTFQAIPNPSTKASNPTQVYSYGRTNSYGHPAPGASRAHAAHGWSQVYETPNGNFVIK